MTTKVQLVANQLSTNNFGTSRNTLQATCILCRVLWPAIRQHRHLLVDNSSEAKTLLVSTKEKL